MKTLNKQIAVYTQQLQQGEIQIAYKGILAFIGKLRAAFIKKYPYYDVSSIYQGYLDMSYFSLSTKPLKDKGLKIAIVYLHEKGSFEVWLFRGHWQSPMINSGQRQAGTKLNNPLPQNVVVSKQLCAAWQWRMKRTRRKSPGTAKYDKHDK